MVIKKNEMALLQSLLTPLPLRQSYLIFLLEFVYPGEAVYFSICRGQCVVLLISWEPIDQWVHLDEAGTGGEFNMLSYD